MDRLKNDTFRTLIHPEKYEFEIDYNSRIMFIGSCFAENIGRRMEKLKFKVDINPFGIIYNPVSVKNALDKLILLNEFKEDDLFYFNERWSSFLHHGSFSGIDKNATLDRINKRLILSSEFLRSTDFLFITFGTAWVYEYKKSNSIVSNCHKIPNKEFVKYCLKAESIIDDYKELHKQVKLINKDLKFIYTLSPVRHLKDGFIENSMSKAILRYAISEIVNTQSNAYYFPAYEIQMDDLRDYRFYDTDLVHPNNTASEYIYSFFSESFFDIETKKLNKKIEKINRSINHKPFNTDTEKFRNFVQNTINDISNLKNFGFSLDFELEKKELTDYIQ
jgi:hypothetical protein